MPTPNPQPGSFYADPFRFAKVIPERVDMGVDFQGTGPVYAVAPGIITEADTAWANSKYGSGIAPGTFVAEKITKGPAKGQTFYYAEQLQNVKVHRGQRVDTSTHIADFVPGGQTEFGWAEGGNARGVTKADEAKQYDWKGDPTAYGASAAYFLHSTGAPMGLIHGKPSGTLAPGWYPQGKLPVQKTTNATTTSWITSLFGGALGGSGWKDLVQRGGIIILGGALIIVGIILLAGKQSIKIGTAAVAPEATAAQKIKARAMEIRAQGAARA